MFKKFFVSVITGIVISSSVVVAQDNMPIDLSPPIPNYGITGIPNWPHSHGETHEGMHEYYKKLSNPKYETYSPGSCCNNRDCDIVRAWYDEKKGNWVAVINGEKWDVPPETIITKHYPEAPDGNSHVCIIGGKIVCFVRGLPKG